MGAYLTAFPFRETITVLDGGAILYWATQCGAVTSAYISYTLALGAPQCSEIIYGRPTKAVFATSKPIETGIMRSLL